MSDYKKQAALAAVRLIEKGMSVGLGAGATIAHLARALAADPELAASLTLLSSSQETITLLQELQLNVVDASAWEQIDWYFDGCDQLDRSLNALKSGAGIHTAEKILATMAKDFVLLADAGKLVDVLDASFPLVLEVLPEATSKIRHTIAINYPTASVTLRKDGEMPKLTARNNFLIDLRFDKIPPLQQLDAIKMWAGVVDHSLFYRIASRAIVAGPAGIETIVP
jgi:ribose 5-phosphate isomerase A